MRINSLTALAAVLLLLTAFSSQVRAQGDIPATPGWTPPVLIFDGSRKAIPSFVLVEDPSGHQHALWSYDSDGDNNGDVVYYSRNNGGSWIAPIDVLVRSDYSHMPHVDAAADSVGRLFVVLGQASLACYVAPAEEAFSAKNWVRISCGPDVQVVDARLIVDRLDNLHLVYVQRGGNIYHTKSEDQGFHWSLPVEVIQVLRTDTATDGVDVAVGQDDVIHVVWSENILPQAYPPSGVYYARSTDGGSTWSSDLELGGTYANQPRLAVTTAGVVHAVWGSSLQDKGKYHRWSTDNGQTWSAVTLVERHVTGATYKEQIALDGADHPHWIMAEDPGDRYAIWSTDHWTPSEEILLPTTGQWASTYRPFGTSFMIGQGNRAELLLRTVEVTGEQKLWYTWRQVDAPTVSTKQLLDPAETRGLPKAPTPEPPRATALPSPTAAPPANPPTVTFVDSTPTTQVSPIVVSIVPALLFVGAVVILRLSRARRN